MLVGMGCLGVTFSGGEPLLRRDFLALYRYAKRKGLLVTVFTNAALVDEPVARALGASPPVCVEASLYGISEKTYAAVTGVAGACASAHAGLSRLKSRGVPTIVKAVCLKENRHEIAAIKRSAEKLFGRPGNGLHRFKYDYVVVPRLDGGLEPCAHRVTPAQLQEMVREDKEMEADLRMPRVCVPQGGAQAREAKYACNSWQQQCVIDPFGFVKFCQFSRAHAFHVDRAPLSRYLEVIREVSRERFRGESLCRDCARRYECFWCPSRAALETGDDESAVEYYCQMAAAQGAYACAP
jgi:MoaA/NifB/PqqE/SkfB family radical SAM enzyme